LQSFRGAQRLGQNYEQPARPLADYAKLLVRNLLADRFDVGFARHRLMAILQL